MTSQGNRWRLLGPALVIVVLAVMAVRVWLAVAMGGGTSDDRGLFENTLLLLAFSTYFVVGTVLIARRPDHRLGWVLTAVGVLTAFGVLAESYAYVGLVLRPGQMPGAVFAAWFHNWYWFPLLVLILLFVPMLFPTGRPLTPRWNWLYWSAVAVLTLMTVASWTTPTLTDGSIGDPAYAIPNPIGVGPAGTRFEDSALGGVLFGADGVGD
ncbi:MAG TPA: hypothetical protein VM307_10545, partial [Egibacteraceae bacterium]|nr:hypothetical protein [Egibacteraceae bacterium]